MIGVDFAWGSSNTTVGTVNDTGFFTANATGTTMVNATNGTVTGTASVTVTDADPTAPVVNTVTLNTTAPNTDDAILVTVNATDNVVVTNVTANGVGLTAQGDNIWNGTITAIEGTHSVNVSAKDAAGNVGWNNSTSYTATTSDATAPVVNTVTLNTTAPNTGDAILVTVNATDEVEVTNVTAGDVELTSQGGNIWNGTITATEGTHSVNVSAKDAAGNTGWNNSTSYNATTPDTTAPVISAVANGTPSVSSVTITWTTDEASASVVKYGTTSGAYTLNKSNTSMVTLHSIMLTGLESNRTYYFVVNSTDASGNSNESAEHNFTTASPIVQINSWTLPATGSRGTAIDATVNITNTGTETLWFVVSVAGTSTTGESIVGLGTIELGAGITKDVHVKISVSGDADYTGTYTLIPDVYTFGGYPDVSTLQATGSGDTIVIS
jgi:hypothetical protein